MQHGIGRPNPRIDPVARAIVVVVGLSVAMTLGLLYSLTPPTVATAETPYLLTEK